MKRGFSLMELLVAIAIVAILATIAIASYRSYALKANRTDAYRTLLAIQLAEEKYRMNSATYGTLAQVWNSVAVTPSGFYQLSISNLSGTTYTITATAQGTQSVDAEDGTSCATITLAFANGVTTRTPAACWLD